MSNVYESSENVPGDENQSRGADAMESQWYEEITLGVRNNVKRFLQNLQGIDFNKKILMVAGEILKVSCLFELWPALLSQGMEKDN